MLADVVYIHQEFKPKEIVDLATLTGAIVVSLGHEYGGIFSGTHTTGSEAIHVGQGGDISNYLSALSMINNRLRYCRHAKHW